VPAQYSTNPKLGKWVSKQRARYKKNTEEENSTAMIAEHIRALNCIGFEWGTPSKTTLKSSCPAPASWNERFQELKKYKERIGDCLVPTKYSANPKLGNWVMTQRAHYKLHQEGKSSSMTEERIQTFNDVGFNWRATPTTGATAPWNERFLELKKYKEHFGDCLVHTKYSANAKLGTWVSHQHQYYKLHQEGKASSMTEDRIQALNDVGFNWRANTATTGAAASWYERFLELKKYKEHFGD
jgi:hypothetical protein